MSKFTVSDRLVATDNRPSGFDYMRLFLALGVIVWHSGLLCYGENAEYGVWHAILNPVAMLIVPMFFSLSGFLVAGSFERNKSLVTFLGLRVLRIAPALSVEVLLSALILGPLLTTLSFSSYISDTRFHLYFLNMIGEIHYYLPGVFEQNPLSMVNGQLWTVPYELICYIVLAGIAVLSIYKNRNWLLYAMIVCYCLQILNTIFRARDTIGSATGSTVVMSFIAGILIYRYREKIVLSFGQFILWSAVSIALLSVPNGMRFAMLPIAYITVYLGLMNPSRNRIALSGDYSYGLYLYGFPIQQAFIAISPVFREWYWNLAAAIPSTILIATLSWWMIEKPVMARKSILKPLEQWYINHPLVQRFWGLRFLAGIPAMNGAKY